MKPIVLILTLSAFLMLTAVAVWHHSYVGIFSLQLQSWAGVQVLVDLTIALSLFLVWMWNDARGAGRSPWPWLVLVLATGSIGALLYLIRYKGNPGTSK